MKRIACLAFAFASVAASALAQNGVHTGAKVLIPDGTMLSDVASPISNGGEKWYATVVEGGHSYAVEAFNVNDGLAQNNTTVELYENDGATNFLVASHGACGVDNQAAPSLEGSNGGTDGKRCVIYTALSDATPSRVMKIRVFDAGGAPAVACQNCLTRVRVRDTTIFSRWSTNGYNMYVAVHNPSVTPLSGYVLYYPDAPTGPAGWIAFDQFQLGSMGTTQFVRNASSLNPNHGSIRILTYAVAASAYAGMDATIQTYAFSPSAGTFNFFIPERLNHGGANSLGYNN